MHGLRLVLNMTAADVIATAAVAIAVTILEVIPATPLPLGVTGPGTRPRKLPVHILAHLVHFTDEELLREAASAESPEDSILKVKPLNSRAPLIPLHQWRLISL